MEILETLMACDDCLMYVANDDIPDERPDLRRLIDAQLDMSTSKWLCVGDDAEDEFSWRPCECCGSTLGGRRNQLILMGE